MLRFGSTSLELPELARLAPRLERAEPPALPDPALACRAALTHPIGLPPLAKWVRAGERIAVVVPDLTRHLVPELIAAAVEQIRQAGGAPFVRIANGTHRRLTAEERTRCVPPELAVEVGDRDCDDARSHAPLGTTASGIAAAIDRAVAEADRIVLLGPVSFHYLAGFGGGLKLLAPGLANRATAAAIHRRCLAPAGGRHAEARAGVFPHENPLHQAIAEVAALAPPSFAAVTQQDAAGRLVGVFAGAPAEAHHAACRALDGHAVIETPLLRCVIAGAGGAPYDVDVIQAHKALEAVAGAVEPGGRIVWVASMREGVPSRARRWLDRTASDLEAELRAQFDINGQTLLALRSKAERFSIRAVTDLPATECEALGVAKAASIEEAIGDAWAPGRSAVVPWGARFLLRT